jgi:hypothetical protein
MPVFVHVKVWSAPAFDVGGVMSCDTLTASVDVQPFAVFVTVTVYISGAFADGCAIPVLFSPNDGDHEYVLPMITAVPMLTEGLLQVITLSAPASAGGGVISCDTTTVSFSWQPLVELVAVKI